MNKDTNIDPEEAPISILNSRSSVCMSNNDKYAKHTKHISRRSHFARNDKKCKMHKIDWCERGIKLADIETKNVGENDLNPRIKYIMGIIDN